METEVKGVGLSVAAMVLGIISMLCCCVGFPFAIIGLILAIIALVKKRDGKGFAIAGLITSIITLIVSIYVAASMIAMKPYQEGIIDFYSNIEEYVDEYDEDGSLPPVFEDMIDDGIVQEEKVIEAMDKMSESLASAREKQDE